MRPAHQPSWMPGNGPQCTAYSAQFLQNFRTFSAGLVWRG